MEESDADSHPKQETNSDDGSDCSQNEDGDVAVPVANVVNVPVPLTPNSVESDYAQCLVKRWIAFNVKDFSTDFVSNGYLEFVLEETLKVNGSKRIDKRSILS